MIILLRSIIFNILFYTWTLFCGIIFLPTLILPRFFVLKVTKIWIYGVVLICDYGAGLHLKIVGEARLLTFPAIFAIKHQSSWETLIIYYLLKDPAIVLKRDLLWIPFFGWHLQKMQMISLSRSKKNGLQDLKNLLTAADKAITQNRPIVIFPEGTRSRPGHKTTYHSGIASLYLHLGIPVIPVAHNAGLFWPRRGFLKYPGTIILELLDPIQPGLSRQEFMSVLENTIETKTNELLENTRVKKRKS